MTTPITHDPSDEVRSLRRTMNDLLSVLALPALWSGTTPKEIAHRLCEALRGMLSLDLVYISVGDENDGGAVEAAAVSPELERTEGSSEIGAELRAMLGSWNPDSRPEPRMRFRSLDLTFALTPIGVGLKLGVILAAARRPAFPTPQEQLVLTVSANQAAAALQEARLRDQQRRVTEDLERRVVARTGELRAANAALELEVAERTRAERALSERMLDAQAVIDGIPGIVVVMAPDGSIETTNRQNLEYLGITAEELRSWGMNGVVHPDDLPAVMAGFGPSIATGKPFRFEQRVRRHDGVYRWFEARGIAVRDSRGEVARWYALVTDIDDRKRAEQAVADNERNLQNTIDSLPALAWSARPDGAAEFFNRHYLEYVGRPIEEMRGWQWTAAVHPDDLAMTVRNWKEFMTAGVGGEVEARLRRADGVYRSFLLRANPQRDAHGAIVKWHGVNTDIEERKRALRLLEGERRLLEMIVSGRPLREVLVATCRMVEAASPECYCDIHSIDWSGPTIEYAVAPSLPPSYTDPIAGTPLRPELLPCGIVARENVQVVSEDFATDPRWCTAPVRDHALAHGLRSVWSTPICATSGAVLGTLCIYQGRPAVPSPLHQDVIGRATRIASIAIERLEAEAELRRNRASLADAQQISLTGSFSWMEGQDVHSSSDQLRRIFELTGDAPVSFTHLADRVHPDDVPVFVEKWEDVREGRDSAGDEIRLLMPDGRLKFVRVFGRTIRHADGRLECIGAVQDVTAQRQAEDALNDLRTDLSHVTRVMSLGTLTASIAHEVNQPLSGIITNASTCLRMLGADPPDVAGALETARRTMRDGKRAADVIARLRALFRKTEFVAEQVDLNDAAREVIVLSRQELRRRGVAVQMDFADELPPIMGDRVQLQQVITNLLLNAADAMSTVETDRRIVVETRGGGEVVLAVRDSGVGIDPAQISRVFDAFFTTKADGMGIGLSVSKSIIEQHRGRLWAEPNPSGGTTVSFALPLHPMESG